MRLFSRAPVSMAPIVENSLGSVTYQPVRLPAVQIVENSLVDFNKVTATNLRATFLALVQAAEHVAKGGLIISLVR